MANPSNSDTTRILLNYWFYTDHRLPNGRKFAYHYFQREAIETLIYLYEVANVRRHKSLAFIANTKNGYLIELAHDGLDERVKELEQHYQMPVTVEMEMDLHQIHALKTVEMTRKRLEKYHQRDFFRATRDEVIDALNTSLTTIIEGRGWYPEDESPGDLFVKRFLGPSFVANLEKWMRS